MSVPRQARKKSKTGIYHIVLRGVNKQNIFEDDDDRRFFLTLLAHFKEICGYEIYAYCLMDNHVHLELKEGFEPLGTSIKRIIGKYVLAYNKKHERCGHLFQERFKSEPIETDSYFLTVLRYILQNPDKANLQGKLQNRLWTSYIEYINGARIVDTGFVLAMFTENISQALKQFNQFINRSSDEKCLEYEDKVSLSDMELIEYINDLGLKSEEIRNLPNSDRDAIIRKLKTLDGITIRQIAKITGLSKSMVGRI
ncbi:MAG: transposase [Bacillota bacterium]|nr:transposase [Bacillota bacterium]